MQQQELKSNVYLDFYLEKKERQDNLKAIMQMFPLCTWKNSK